MTRDQTIFAIWAVLLVGAATFIILYQHSIHSGVILNAIGGNPGGASAGGAGVAGTINANPINTGATSRATGIWTPTGPASGLGPFPYNPAQYWQ